MFYLLLILFLCVASSADTISRDVLKAKDRHYRILNSEFKKLKASLKKMKAATSLKDRDKARLKSIEEKFDLIISDTSKPKIGLDTQD